ncbi:hypothetical protein [Chryseobacterium luquanense]|uniref:NTF2 fold immunity protein domain-containing protein n=1 Tax=Chryseobacterium luquanense TaxID=2983766 RepID=A0ABT3Y5E5_9FLAO|nr:hypothetical protein [Chryseobacterium luquanense]MCX8533369.1 hypothetical protein [Chryseobacterium luquanense]
MIENLRVDKSQTPEKFQHLTKEILDFLIDKLQTLDNLEKEIYERYQVLQLDTNPNQAHEDEDGLWEEYFQRCEKIIAPISIKPYKDNRTFGKPTHYDYLNNANTKIILILKSINRGIVELQFDNGVAKKEQFIIKKDNDSWKIDTKKYSFPGEGVWRKDEI